MSAADKSGPAFPNWSDNHYTEQRSRGGMSLRDYLAAKAMQGFAAYPSASWTDGIDGMARSAYKWADAMLKARASA